MLPDLQAPLGNVLNPVQTRYPTRQYAHCRCFLCGRSDVCSPSSDYWASGDAELLVCSGCCASGLINVEAEVSKKLAALSAPRREAISARIAYEKAGEVTA